MLLAYSRKISLIVSTSSGYLGSTISAVTFYDDYCSVKFLNSLSLTVSKTTLKGARFFVSKEVASSGTIFKMIDGS